MPLRQREKIQEMLRSIGGYVLVDLTEDLKVLNDKIAHLKDYL